MQAIKITISLELFEKLYKAGHIKSGEYLLDKIDDPDFDYSDDEQWVQAKANSSKEYKKLKEIEYNLRHKS